MGFLDNIKKTARQAKKKLKEYEETKGERLDAELKKEREKLELEQKREQIRKLKAKRKKLEDKTPSLFS